MTVDFHTLTAAQWITTVYSPLPAAPGACGSEGSRRRLYLSNKRCVRLRQTDSCFPFSALSVESLCDIPTLKAMVVNKDK